jgi:hypothetical protein
VTWILKVIVAEEFEISQNGLLIHAKGLCIANKVTDSRYHIFAKLSPTSSSSWTKLYFQFPHPPTIHPPNRECSELACFPTFFSECNFTEV